jgi:hypothetical protein
MEADLRLWNTAALPVLAGAIHGHAMITRFSTGSCFPFYCLDILCSTLLTLPALEIVYFAGQLEDEAQSLESMAKLLQAPALRVVEFESVVFANTLSQAVVKALKERSGITELRFERNSCSFPEGGSAVIASALKTNTTLKWLHFYSQADESFMKSWQRLFYPMLRCRILDCLPRLAPAAARGCHHCSWLYK